MSQYFLDIVTPERSFFSGEVEAVSVTTLSGRIQLLAHHINYASGLVPSVVKIKQAGNVKYASIAGGFIEFTNNRATILADSAEWPEEIDVKRAEASLDRAKERLKNRQDNIDKKRAQMAIMKSLARIKASENRK